LPLRSAFGRLPSRPPSAESWYRQSSSSSSIVTCRTSRSRPKSTLLSKHLRMYVFNFNSVGRDQQSGRA
jgi:hypothetical protein